MKSTKLTNEMIKEISVLLLEGNTIEQTCHITGISTGSFLRWRKLGKESSIGIFRALYSELQRVEVTLEKNRQEKHERLLKRKVAQIKKKYGKDTSRSVKLT